tara:strand:+ start:91967 stop:92134 length:168 start_codon:yes stop_codon:yes gene_type:complete
MQPRSGCQLNLVLSRLAVLLTYQWQHLLKVQQIQTDLIEEVTGHGPAGVQKKPTG